MDNTDEEGQPPTLMDTSSLFSEAMAGGVQASTLASKGSFDYFSPKHDLQHDYPTHGAPEVAVLGRSNVGKSSLVNSVLQKSLCITSKSPGRTQLPHYYGWRAHGAVRMDLSKTASTKSSGKDPSTVQGYIVDLPGYGFGNAPTSVVEGWQQNTQDWLLHRRHEAQVLKRLFLLMDARRDEPNDWDRTVLRWLEDAEIPYTIVLTKADRVSVPLVVKQVNDFCLRYASQESEAEERMDDEGHVPFVAQSPVVHVTSSKRGWGIAELILSIETEFFGEDELLESIE
jgi:GTP-binding protein